MYTTIAIIILASVAFIVANFLKDKCVYKSQKQEELNEVFDHYEKCMFKESEGINVMTLEEISTVAMNAPKTELGYCFRRYFLIHLKETMDAEDITFNSIQAKQAAETAYGSCMTDYGLPEMQIQ